MTTQTQVAVIGATGYSGFELAKILLRHPHVARPVFFMRESPNGAPGPKCLTQVFPHLRGWGEAPCRVFSVDAVKASGAQVAFLATPHEASLGIVPALLQAGLRVVDLSGAFRFHSAETFSNWYNLPAPDGALLNEAVYGMPELYGDALPQARLVANPGCYPTSVILGLKPLVQAGWLAADRGIVCDCKSGATGAGKEPKRDLHFVEVDENFKAYGLFTHRHTPEVTEHLGLNLNDVMFSTHLLPIARGILSTLYVWLREKHTAADIETLYRTFYAEGPMVRLWPAGKLPEVQHVANTNFCDIGFALAEDGQRLVIVSCLDNLGKGAAGQAVQSMNFMIGCKESAGLV